MTRKHYNNMAARFATLLAHNTYTYEDPELYARQSSVWQCIDEYIEHAALDNPAFDETRFRAYIQTAKTVKLTQLKYEAAV